MSEDATLETFAGSTADDGQHDDEGAEPGGGDEVSKSGDGDGERPEPGENGDEATEQPEPPSLTYTSSPDGDACAECGETVQNRWRAGEGAPDPDALVCPDCKVW